jgi:hypothetical protein
LYLNGISWYDLYKIEKVQGSRSKAEIQKHVEISYVNALKAGSSAIMAASYELFRISETVFLYMKGGRLWKLKKSWQSGKRKQKKTGSMKPPGGRQRRSDPFCRRL